MVTYHHLIQNKVRNPQHLKKCRRELKSIERRNPPIPIYQVSVRSDRYLVYVEYVDNYGETRTIKQIVEGKEKAERMEKEYACQLRDCEICREMVEKGYYK